MPVLKLIFQAPVDGKFKHSIGGVLKVKPEFERLYSEANFNRVFGSASEEHKRNSFAVGLEHGNSTMGNTLMNVIFLREHNRIAEKLGQKYSDWDDERIFQTARNINIVLLLNIVISDYIVHISPVNFPLRAVPGMAEQENWYRTNWIAVEFALLYRWHSFIPETVTFNDEKKVSDSLRHNNSWLQEIGIDDLCRQASSQKAGRLGLGNTPEFMVEVSKLSLRMARRCHIDPPSLYKYFFVQLNI